MSTRIYPYPFSAIVGQEDMKLGLILNIADPKLGESLLLVKKELPNLRLYVPLQAFCRRSLW